MLVLSRRRGESIVINEQIRVEVIEIRGDRVRLGVEAPREMSVHRTEVLAAIQHARLPIHDRPAPDGTVRS